MPDRDNAHSLADFQRDPRAFVDRLRKTGRPEALTVAGEAAVVIQSVEAYQRLLDIAMNGGAIAGVQRGLMGMHAGTGEDADEAFAALERELGIPRAEP